MYRLQKASAGFKRVNMSHLKALLVTLPIILVEVIILTIFSFIDPSQITETLGVGNNSFEYQQVLCEQSSNAFFIVQNSYNGKSQLSIYYILNFRELLFVCFSIRLQILRVAIDPIVLIKITFLIFVILLSK